MERTRAVLALALFAGSVLWWTEPGQAQTNAPPSTASASDATVQKRVQDLEEIVKELREKLEALQSGAKEPSPASPVEDRVQQLDQKVRILEREKEIDKEAAEAKAKETPVVSLKDGFSVKTPDNKFQLKLGGYVLYDAGLLSQDPSLRRALGEERDATGFRSTRLRVSGSFYDTVDYQLETDFIGKSSNAFNAPVFADTYVQVHGIPALGGNTGRLRAGHFREPFSMEELTSSPFDTFLEDSLANVFVPSRNVGVQWSEALLGEKGQERLTYAVGVFKTTNSFAFGNNDGYSVTGRITGLPWYEYNGEHLLHLALAYSHREPQGAVLNWNARPETRLSQFRYAAADATNTGFRLRDARVEAADLLDLEAAFVYGPFSFQSEYMLAQTDTRYDGGHTFSGWYAQAGYFLTGEYRPYRTGDGLFDRVKPNHNFGFGSDGGWGAWELALRYSSVDLQDGLIRGGTQDAITAGVNWFLNPNARLTLNYVYNDIEHDLYEGNLNALQLRFGVAF